MGHIQYLDKAKLKAQTSFIQNGNYMESEFWHSRWENNEIGFHMNETHPLLAKHFERLLQTNNNDSATIFVPLCGKTLDILWFLNKGHEVVAVELSELAISQLFADLRVTPSITQIADFKVFHGPQLKIFVGDIFSLKPEHVGKVSYIYDRAALVALPEHMRPNYCQQLIQLSNKATQLLISFDYDQQQMPGPPFSVTETAIRSYYQSAYSLELLESQNVEGKLKGKCEALEQVWLLKN